MEALRTFGAFWYDFIVGDDWRIAAAVLVALGLTAALAHSHVAIWPGLPLAVVVALGASLWRATAV